ncbi:hypothetical protein, partial [Bacillus sp. AFS059628]|uniref:hypothetical protein n=1 Tax=Bacillus sp. AFS059628 TaxID=2033508 RepID=UPI001C54FF30
ILRWGSYCPLKWDKKARTASTYGSGLSSIQKDAFLFFFCFPSKLESSPHYFFFILFISLVFPQARIKKALTASIHGSGLSSI